MMSSDLPGKVQGGGRRAVLMLALQFPPFAQSTGRLRILSFVRHLPAEGWEPIVIAGRESIYPEVDPRTMKEIPEDATIIRAWGFDLVRALSIRGIYPRWLATPDRWVLWAVGAVKAGLAAIRRHRVQAIWATFPVPSDLLAALVLHRLTRLPLIVDLRDPLVYESWPTNRWDRRVYGWLDRKVVNAASAVVVTTPGARTMYQERYPHLPRDRFRVIANGIEDSLSSAATGGAPSTSDEAGPIVLVHSGIMETPDRNPEALFRALRLLSDQHALPQRPLKVVLRGSGFDAAYQAAARAHGVDSIVSVLPHVARHEAVAEVAAATGLLLFQGPECNRQIPAKAYEYLAAGKPIIGFMDPRGDSHALVAGDWGVPYVADMNAPEKIAEALRRFFADLEAGCTYIPPSTMHARYMRRARATELGRLLDTVGVRPSQAGLAAAELEE